MNVKVAVLALAASAGVTAAIDCGPDELGKLAGLASNPRVSTCSTASGWSMLPPSGYPTADQNAKMCATPDCHVLIKDIIKLNPSDCMLSFGSVSLNIYELANGFETGCFSSTPAPAMTATPSITTVTPSATSTTPSITTATPSATTATPLVTAMTPSVTEATSWGTDTPSVTPAAISTTPSYC